MEQEKKESFLQISLFDKKSAVEKLIEESATTKEFYLLLLSSTVIITLGLILDNSSIVIGGMLLTPLFSPLLTIGLGVILSNTNIIAKNFTNFIKLVVVIIITSFIISWVVNAKEANVEILLRTIPNVEYFLVALVAGFMGTYFWVKPHMQNLISGVIVAVALVPPLSCLGIGMRLFSQDIISGSLMFFILNFFGIVAGSTLAFSLFGFGKKSEQFEKAIDQKVKEVHKE